MATKQQQREIAIGAARAELRRAGIDPATVDGRAALFCLDDLARVEPGLIASLWYADASTAQIRLFLREWKKGGGA